MNQSEIHAVMLETEAGQLSFPHVVRRLLAAGVESYFVDFAAGAKHCYLAEGGVHSDAMTLPLTPVAGEFSSAGLVQAIRGAQADTIRYPEFVRLSTDAGVVGYWAFLTGKKVIYFGRKGETHTELFPPPQPPASE